MTVNGAAQTMPAAYLVFSLQLYQETLGLTMIIRTHKQMHTIYVKS
jgi:hypothetical protein